MVVGDGAMNEEILVVFQSTIDSIFFGVGFNSAVE
jgi:hypothetical protein